MADFYNCFACGRVLPLMNDRDRQAAEKGTCPSCGEPGGEILSQAQFNERIEVGAIHNIDIKTGKPAKKRPR
jgi:hypothetical protein